MNTGIAQPITTLPSTPPGGVSTAAQPVTAPSVGAAIVQEQSFSVPYGAAAGTGRAY